MTLAALLAAGLIAAPAAPTPADEAATPPAVEDLKVALRDSNPTRFMSLWPKSGKVVLFGKAVPRERAASVVRFEDGVWGLTRWPHDREHGAEPQVTRSAEGKLRLWRFRPEGQAGPVCTLVSKKNGPLALAGCEEKAK